MDTPRTQSTDRIKQMEKAVETARSKWSGIGVSIGSIFGTPQDQVLGAISNIQKNLEKWKTQASRLAPADQKGWDTWVKDGNMYLKNLAEIAEESSFGTIQGIVAATVVETAKNVKAIPVAVYKAKTQIAFVFAAIAVVVVAVMFRNEIKMVVGPLLKK